MKSSMLTSVCDRLNTATPMMRIIYFSFLSAVAWVAYSLGFIFYVTQSQDDQGYFKVNRICQDTGLVTGTNLSLGHEKNSVERLLPSINLQTETDQSILTGRSKDSPGNLNLKASMTSEYSEINEKNHESRYEVDRKSSTAVQLNNSNFNEIEVKWEGTIHITNATNSFSWIPEGDSSLWNCKNFDPDMRCKYSSNTLEVWNTSEAVLFRAFHYNAETKFPRYQPPGQKWIFDEHESPFKTWNDFRYKQDIWNQFNLSVVYTQDADVQHYMYAFECEVDYSKKVPERNFAKDKTGEVLWMVGNCHWTSGREYYVDELKKHIHVDIFGYCGQGIKCGNNRATNGSCVSKLLSHYKFYLAFENSFCEDYYTEKIGKTLRVDTVPVVMGLTNYTRLLTPGTFIDVRDFTSPKALALYLKYLSHNHTAYNEIIKRRRRVTCKRKFQHSYMCDLCRHLHEHRNQVQILPDVREFWGVTERCKSPQKFFKGIADIILRRMPVYKEFPLS